MTGHRVLARDSAPVRIRLHAATGDGRRRRAAHERGPDGGPAALAGAAPARIVAAGYDPLRDEGVAYADPLAEAGVPVLRLAYPGMVHRFLQFAGAIRAARAAQRDSAAVRQNAFGTAESPSLVAFPFEKTS